MNRRKPKIVSAAAADSTQAGRDVSNNPVPNRANPFHMMHSFLRDFRMTLSPKELDNSLAFGGSVIMPVVIQDVLDADETLTPRQLLADTAESLRWCGGETDAVASEELCQLAFRFVERLNLLAKKQMLGDAPKAIPQWPINFAPGASEGASKMTDEASLFNRLGVGSNCSIPTNPKPRAGMAKEGKGGWLRETNAALEATFLNARLFMPMTILRNHSKLVRSTDYWHPRMKTELRVQFYRTPSGRILVQPWWFDDILKICAHDTGRFPPVVALGKDTVAIFEPVIAGLVLWHQFFGGMMADLQQRVVDDDEGGSAELATYDPDLAVKVMGGVRNTLRALAGVGRRGTGAV